MVVAESGKAKDSMTLTLILKCYHASILLYKVFIHHFIYIYIHIHTHIYIYAHILFRKEQITLKNLFEIYNLKYRNVHPLSCNLLITF